MLIETSTKPETSKGYWKTLISDCFRFLERSPLRSFRLRRVKEKARLLLVGLSEYRIRTMTQEDLHYACQVIGQDTDEVTGKLNRILDAALEYYDSKVAASSSSSAITVIEQNPNSEISDDLVSHIEDAIARRDINKALSMLNGCRKLLELVSAKQKNAAILLGCYAWAIDLDSSYFSLVKQVLPEFQRMPEGILGDNDRIYLDLARGLIELHEERPESAISIFKSVIKDADEYQNFDMMSISRFYMGRAYWKQALYHESLPYINEAIELHKYVDRPARRAVIQLMQAWLFFQLGIIQDARDVLQQIDETLLNTNDHISRGDVLSCFGRIAKEDGDFDKATELFYRAIAEYCKCDQQHPHIARTYVNMASVCHLKIRESNNALRPAGEIMKICEDALNFLASADDIYGKDAVRNNRGLGKVYLTRALLCADFDMPDWAQAAIEHALMLGQETGDPILLGRAKRIQCRNESDPILSLEFGKEAIAHAEKTHNIRLQARAYRDYRDALCRPPNNKTQENLRKAEEYARKIRICLTPDLKERPYWQKACQNPVTGSHDISLYCV